MSAFRFQLRGDCEANSRWMQWALTNILVGGGFASRLALESPNESSCQWPIESAGALLKVNAECGPLVLTLFRALAADQGADVYLRQHCVVLLTSFRHRERDLGLLLDGNDLQNNPVMDHLREWLRNEGRGRSVGDLTSEELIQIGRTWAHQTGNKPELHQSAFRLVDLGELIRRSRAEDAHQSPAGWWEWLMGNAPRTQMRWAKYYKCHKPCLSDQALCELKALVDQNPQLVETAMPERPEL